MLFKVKHFSVTWKHFITPYNNIGFNSKGSEDMATEIRLLKIAGFDYSTAVWGHLAMEPLGIGLGLSAGTLKPSLSWVYRLHIVADSMRVSFFQISVVSAETLVMCAVQCGRPTAVEGHSRSLILVTVNSAYVWSI